MPRGVRGEVWRLAKRRKLILASATSVGNLAARPSHEIKYRRQYLAGRPIRHRRKNTLVPMGAASQAKILEQKLKTFLSRPRAEI